MAKTIKKLPKRIAGVKIPKGMRKGPIVDFVNSSAGQLLLIEALAVASGYALTKVNPNSAVGSLVHRPVDALRRMGRDGAASSQRLSHALAEGLRTFRAALTEPVEEEHPTAENAEDFTEEMALKKASGEQAMPH